MLSPLIYIDINPLYGLVEFPAISDPPSYIQSLPVFKIDEFLLSSKINDPKMTSSFKLGGSISRIRDRPF